MKSLHGTFRGRTVSSAFLIRFDLEGTGIGGRPVISGDIMSSNFELSNYVASFYSTGVEITDDRLVAAVDFPEKPFTGRVTCALGIDDEVIVKLEIINYMRAVVSTERFSLEKEGDHFRRLELEIDLVQGTAEPGEHMLNQLQVTVYSCLERAGIQLLPSVNRTIIDPTNSGNDTRWSQSELNAVMERHFSDFRGNSMDWRIYLMVATRFLKDDTTGIMFDNFGRQRQGVAVFHTTRAARSLPANFQRDYIRTAVHELGHALNLLHSTDAFKRFGAGKRSLSFMNYPHEFENGEMAYWQNFSFDFDAFETLFLRHGDLMSVIPGGRPFGTGGHDGSSKNEFFSTSKSVSGIQLELRIHSPFRDAILRNRTTQHEANHFRFGEPVHIEAKLTNISGEDREVEDLLDSVHMVAMYRIKKPNGEVIVHSPLLMRCCERRTAYLHPEKRPSIYENIDLTFGARGFNFVEPGLYEIHCHYPIGDMVLSSNVLRIWIKYPTVREESMIPQVFDDCVGTYLTLWGSEGKHLERAKSILESIEQDQTLNDHPLVDWSYLCRAKLATHGFKSIDDGGRLVHLINATDNPESLKRALGVNRTYSRGRPVHLSNLVVGHLWRTLLRITEESAKDSVVRKRLDKAIEDLGGLKVKKWAMDRLLKDWGLDQIVNKSVGPQK
jgi:hypothetical protein